MMSKLIEFFHVSIILSFRCRLFRFYIFYPLNIPEYMDMSEQDILKYKSITSDTLPSSPIISQNVSLDKDKGFLDISFIPIVYRNGKYQKIVSLCSRRHLRPSTKSKLVTLQTRSTTSSERYASHSVLATG